jgi:hypothetical protein
MRENECKTIHQNKTVRRTLIKKTRTGTEQDWQDKILTRYKKEHERQKEKIQIGSLTKEHIEECKTMSGREEKEKKHTILKDYTNFFNLTIQMSSWQQWENAQIDWLAMTSPRVGHGRIPASCHGT